MKHIGTQNGSPIDAKVLQLAEGVFIGYINVRSCPRLRSSGSAPASGRGPARSTWALAMEDAIAAAQRLPGFIPAS